MKLFGLKELIFLGLLFSSVFAWGSNLRDLDKTEARSCTGDCLKTSFTDPTKLLRDWENKIAPKRETFLPETLSYAKALSKSAKRQSTRCRTPASRVAKKMGLKKGQKICGNQSKSMCFQAFKHAVLGAGLTEKYLDGERAIEAHSKKILEKEGFQNAIRLFDEYTAPVGAILVYEDYVSKRPNGHIEAVIETKTKKGYVREYCSDFCSARPVTATALPRKLVAVYIKKDEFLTAKIDKPKTQESRETL